MANKTCNKCETIFEISEWDTKFYTKLSQSMGLENEGIFEPNICLFCREQARLVFRNERYYYRRTCDACGKSIISVYNPETVSNVFCHACWWSDKWSATTYGREYDPDVPFFSQYKELLAATPKLAMMNDNGSGSENCEYTYDFAYGKNVYLVVGAWHTRDSMYGYQINRVKSCIDNDWVNESEYMYNCIACERCYGLQECMQCYESRDCVFGFDLIGCQDCLFCAGIRHKQYCIRNVQYTREEYLRKKNSLELGNWGKRESYHVEFLKFIRDVPRKYAHLVRCENCTGDYLVNSRNSFECFFQRNLHGCKWMTSGDGAKDSYECYSTGDPELCYNCITPDNSYGVAFSIFCWKSQYVLYSDNCHSSHHLFGCIWMKKWQYSILNKQYSSEEYTHLQKKIIQNMQKHHEWGNFFRPDVTPFAYNETVSQQWYPLDEKNSKQRGYQWNQKLPGSFQKGTLSWNEIPDTISKIEKDWISSNKKKIWEEVLACTNCGKNFQILEHEFVFYKNFIIPLPKTCPDCRYKRRKILMRPRRLWERTCACEISGHDHEGTCNNTFQTTYVPNSPENVFCEKCYLKTIG